MSFFNIVKETIENIVLNTKRIFNWIGETYTNNSFKILKTIRKKVPI